MPASAPQPVRTPRKLAPHEIDAAARALGRAFYDDPLMTYLMPSDAKRTANMTHVMRSALRMALPEDEIYTTDAPEGAALFLPPGRSKVPLSRVLRVVLPEAWRFGIGSLRRYMAVTDEFEHKHPAGDHWYLMTLGVDPDCQGQGLGGAMMSGILKRAEAAGTTVYLETNKPRNVVFYQKHGFKVVEHFRCHGGRGPETWTLIRENGQFHS
jgi:ribosomal protein S18 acetylase RimI-like enzyme